MPQARAACDILARITREVAEFVGNVASEWPLALLNTFEPVFQQTPGFIALRASGGNNVRNKGA